MTYDAASKVTERFVNGIKMGSTTDTAAQSVFNNLTIGGSSIADSRLNGYIGEILIYDAVLSTIDRKKAEAYLSAKYGFGVGV